MKILLIVVLAAAQGLMPRAGTGEADVTTHGLGLVPKGGTFAADLSDGKHSGYLRRPGCWAKELGKKQHIFRIKNDNQTITIYDAHPGSAIEWECHGFMRMTPYESCTSQARTKEAFFACGPPPSEVH